MPVITFSSPKGGAGKTTAATILATVWWSKARRSRSSTPIRTKTSSIGRSFPGKPTNLTVIGEVTEETIVDQIEEAAEKSAFVIVDLEGTASLMVSYAISMSDFVVIPVQGSQLDAKQAARQMKLIKAQERIAGRAIPFAVLFTRTNPAIMPKTQRFIEERFFELQVPIFSTKLFDREAFRAMFSYGGTISGLKDKGVSNLTAALNNALEFTSELVERLRNGNKSVVKEVA